MYRSLIDIHGGEFLRELRAQFAILSRAAFLCAAENDHASNWAVEINRQGFTVLIFEVRDGAIKRGCIASGFRQSFGQSQTGAKALGTQGGKITVSGGVIHGGYFPEWIDVRFSALGFDWRPAAQFEGRKITLIVVMDLLCRRLEKVAGQTGGERYSRSGRCKTKVLLSLSCQVCLLSPRYSQA